MTDRGTDGQGDRQEDGRALAKSALYAIANDVRLYLFHIVVN